MDEYLYTPTYIYKYINIYMDNENHNYNSNCCLAFSLHFFPFPSLSLSFLISTFIHLAFFFIVSYSSPIIFLLFPPIRLTAHKQKTGNFPQSVHQPNTKSILFYLMITGCWELLTPSTSTCKEKSVI